MEVEKILAQMTVEEKAALVSGTDFMYTNPIPRLGVPSLCTSDGPHGLRKQTGSGDNGVSESEPATVMCAYNQINGVYCSENKWLLTDVLRDEWGFDGAVMKEFLPRQSPVKNGFPFVFRLARRKIRGVPPLNSPC